jgi:hypothetical protein
MSDLFKPGSILESGMKQVQQVLNNIPEDKKFVWVTTVSKDGVARSGLAVRVDDHWSFGAEAQISLNEKPKPDMFVFVKLEG